MRAIALLVMNIVYGVTFLVMAGALLLYWEHTAKLGVAGRFVLLAIFGVTHGASDLARIHRPPPQPGDTRPERSRRTS